MYEPWLICDGKDNKKGRSVPALDISQENLAM